MSGFFSSENKIFIILGKVFDIMILGIVWLLCCVPVITIGPASTAFYYTVVKVIRRERSYLLKEFFRSFKLNFVQGMLVTLIYAVLAFVMYIDFNYALQLSREGSKIGSMMFGVFIVLSVFVLFTLLYVFPVLSRFTVTIKHLFKWAFYLSVRHILWTLLLAVLFVFTAVVLYFSVFYAPPLVLFLPGIYTLISSFPMERIFKRYMPKEEETDEEAGVDRWYNE